ncbi:MAG: mechanosensitive ion channel family protein [Acidimicrobiales bacterium]
MVVAASSVTELGRWARGSGLEIVLIALGAALLVRFARWALLRAPEQAWRRGPLGRVSRDGGPDLRRARSVAQAGAWVVAALVYSVASLLILARFNVPLASLVPTATVVGVVIGFGAQRVVLDLVSGFFLFAERQLAVGDTVRISPPGVAGGVSGTVEEVTLRVTRLRTQAGEVVFVPNGEIRQLTNLSVDWARVVIDVPVTAQSDLNQAIDVLQAVGESLQQDPQWQGALLEAPTVSGVQALEVGFVRVRLMVRVRAAEQWTVGRELRRRVAVGLREAGIMAPGGPLTEDDGGA